MAKPMSKARGYPRGKQLRKYINELSERNLMLAEQLKQSRAYEVDKKQVDDVVKKASELRGHEIGRKDVTPEKFKEIMELSAETGGQPKSTPFDVNQDGQFTSADYILVPDIDGDGQPDHVPVGGQKSTVGITPTPAVFMTQEKDKEVKVLSGSTGLDTVAENPGTGPSGRQNWREIP